MTHYEVRFHIPAEIIVRLDADDEEAAADAAWGLADQHTKSAAMDDYGSCVSVRIDLDGTAADEVLEHS